ncbi:MAG: hypothetical protein RSB61_05050 [Clostridia bacterium]
MKAKKTKLIILIAAITLVITLITSFFVHIEVKNNPKFYTEAEHLQNVKELMNIRMGENKKDYEIAPMYDINDELFGFVIDYETGHCYIEVHNPVYVLKLMGVSMYTFSGSASAWSRFIDYEKNDSVINWQKTKNEDLLSDYPNRLWEIDQNGEPIIYKNSQFKIANITNEKRYFLWVEQKNGSLYIPAVKRGDKYLNLISMDEFVYNDVASLNKQSGAYEAFFGKTSRNNF